MKNLAMAMILTGAMFMTGCDMKRQEYTVTYYSETGAVISRWEHCTGLRGRTGWLSFENSDGKKVVVDGPHMFTEE